MVEEVRASLIMCWIANAVFIICVCDLLIPLDVYFFSYIIIPCCMTVFINLYRYCLPVALYSDHSFFSPVLVSYCKMMGVNVGAALAISAANSAALAAAQLNHHQMILQQQQVMVAQHQQQQAAAAAAIVAHHQQQQQAAAAALLGAGHVPGAQYTLDDVPRLAEHSANMYASTPEERAAFLQYYQQYYATQIAEVCSLYTVIIVHFLLLFCF